MMRTAMLSMVILAGCTVAPAPLLTLPSGHPGHAESGAAPFTPPANPFQSDVAPPAEKNGGHEHHGGHSGKKGEEAMPSTDYPLDICVVSGEKLGSMGKPVVLHHEGREVRLCCPGCVDDFKKNPEKFLKKLDEAGKKNEEKKPEPRHQHHGGHP